LTRRFGIRSFEFIKQGPFFLNGERLLLRGTHRHEDHAELGAAMDEELLLQEFLLMKEMGVNFIRLGHYQQSQSVLELCDSLGILVWEEIPWCRAGADSEGQKMAIRTSLEQLIYQHFNHPSIIIWGLGNEHDWRGEREKLDTVRIRNYMKEMNHLAHVLDASRKTAIRRCNFVKDILDVYSPSIWAGWYRGTFPEYREVSRREMEEVDHFLHVEWGASHFTYRHSEDPDKGIEEIGKMGSADEREGDFLLTGGDPRVSKNGDWSTTYACNLIDWHLKEQENMPWLTGTAYWPFKDFSTPLRPENPIPYVNQKGVLERDFTKKESYYVFQSYWAETPMVHI
ncbi:MAG: glycoside hydrolase family 2 TIM barrel-domain containing protein, partial [Bacteroidota bacterium]